MRSNVVFVPIDLFLFLEKDSLLALYNFLLVMWTSIALHRLRAITILFCE